jgi:hypothetical protein
MAVITSISTFKQSLTGSAFEALAAVSGDSLSIIAFPDGSRAYVEEIFSGNSASKMEVAVFSPRFGDNQYGLRVQHQFNPTLSGADGDPQLLLPANIDVPVYSTDTLNVQVNGSASDNADVVLQLYYENIQGAGQRLASFESVQGGIVRYIATEVTVTPGTTGSPGTAVAINANDDRFQADMDYVLLGYTVNLPATAFRLRGPDTGFYNIPFPGHWNSRITGDWFVTSGKNRNRAHCPVINANNKATTFIDGLSSTNVGAVKVSLTWGQLGTRFPG